MDDFRWDYYKDGNKLYKAMNLMVAYERGLTTWAEWVEINLDPSKTKVIFRTSSPRSTTSLSYLITLNTRKQSLIMYTKKTVSLAERVVKSATTRNTHCLLLANHTFLNNQEC